MKREILFRGKRQDTLSFCEGYLSDEDVITVISFHDGEKFVDDYLVIPETVGQYSGFSDCTGKRIFEGDLREGSYYRGSERIFYKDVMIFKDGKFSWKSLEGYDSAGMPSFCETQVSGNIHDNPELLK